MTKQELLAKYTAFELKWKNKYLESYDSSNLYQCYDLITEWCVTLGLSKTIFPYLYAYQIYTNFGPEQAKYFTRISNDPDAIPEPGDIVVWSYYYNYTAGHTGLCSFNPGLYRFNGFVQNDPTGQPCIIKNYPYDHILGWLRFKTTSTPNADELVRQAEESARKTETLVTSALKSGDPQAKAKLKTTKDICKSTIIKIDA